MNNLSLYCGLTDARMRASEEDLPVFCTAHLLILRNSPTCTFIWACTSIWYTRVGSLNNKSFVSPRDLTGQSLIDFQGLALSKNAISLWFFMFYLFLCVMSDQTWVQSLNPKAFKAVTR
jgi:hypothetical protein